MTSPRILIVDDEADLRELLEITLIKMGLDTDSAENLASARGFLKQNEYALVLTDMRLPDGSGIDLVREVASTRNTPVAVITAFGSMDNAVAALKAGAFDYLSKPVGLDSLRAMVQSALKLAPTSDHAAHSASTSESTLRLIGQSEAMRNVRSQIARLARSMAPVAITGESGSGKELAARDIHAQSARADKPFIAVNCGAIPEALMEAEFFGYRKGAFTGAAEDREGFFQAANGGTLLLDEVADLPLAMQVKLLRAIQERRVRKVGATAEEAVDVRLISATHQNLAEWVEKGKFRQDLYYRLNVIELRLPPLRERKEDLPMLAEVILRKVAMPGQAPVLSLPALQLLQSHSFPGNVRELENILERATAFSNAGLIEPADLALNPAGYIQPETAFNPAAKTSMPSMPAQDNSLPDLQPVEPVSAADAVEARSESQPALFHEDAEANTDLRMGEARIDVNAQDYLPDSLPDYLDGVERDIILRALKKTRFNRTQAAELLGISFRQLRYRMQRLAIHEPE